MSAGVKRKNRLTPVRCQCFGFGWITQQLFRRLYHLLRLAREEEVDRLEEELLGGPHAWVFHSYQSLTNSLKGPRVCSIHAQSQCDPSIFRTSAIGVAPTGQPASSLCLSNLLDQESFASAYLSSTTMNDRRAASERKLWGNIAKGAFSAEQSPASPAALSHHGQ